MNEKEKKPIKWLAKLKNIKHIEVYVAIIFIVILLLIYMSNISSNGTSTDDSQSTNELTITAYVEDLENNLQDILSNIGGVSNVKVMITLNMSESTVTDSKITIENFPEIKGVIITASGASDTATKMKILHAVEAVIDVKNGNIEILSSD